MQIIGIQNYNTRSTPNFTALRLKSGAVKSLSAMPQKALSYVDSVGEFLKDTKYYHVDISRDVCISHVNGDKYYYPHNIQKSEKIFLTEGKNIGFISIFIHFSFTYWI